AAAQDFEAFASAELAERAELDYPPAARLVSILVSAKEAAKAEAAARRVAAIIRAIEPSVRGAAALEEFATIGAAAPSALVTPGDLAPGALAAPMGLFAAAASGAHADTA